MKLIITLLTLGTLAVASDCEKTKAAFDIGSGATKIKVAKVDVCLQKIKTILLDTSLPVPYKESLQNNSENLLDEKIRNKGVEAIIKLKSLAADYEPESYNAVATSAFRTAANGKEFAREIKAKTGIKPEIIDQDAEAKLGFAGAMANVPDEANEIVVWDIGGGSMQITTYNKEEGFLIYRGKVASASFKKHVIEEIQGKDPEEVSSPNPVQAGEKEIALRDARVVSSLTVPDEIKQKIKKGAKVVGIGGVHAYSVAGQTQRKDFYRTSHIESSIAQRLGKNDSEIGGDYASSEVTNLILVEGFMKGMGIEKVYPKKVNLADGLLIQ